MIVNEASRCMLVIISFLERFHIFIHTQIEFIFQTLEPNTSVWSGPWKQRRWLSLSTLKTFLCFSFFLAYTDASPNADFFGGGGGFSHVSTFLCSDSEERAAVRLGFPLQAVQLHRMSWRPDTVFKGASAFPRMHPSCRQLRWTSRNIMFAARPSRQLRNWVQISSDSPQGI